GGGSRSPTRRSAPSGYDSLLARYDPGYTPSLPHPRRGNVMAQAARKVAISIPGPLYQAVERVRRASGKSRSAVIQDALLHWLEQQAHGVLVREYVAGYRREAEGRREVKAAEAAGG